MGCDIHCYIEYKTEKSDMWWNFGGRINPGRDYLIFALLANVRNYDRFEPILYPKGLPEDIGFITRDDAQLFVSDWTPDEEGCCARESAERWVRAGVSEYTDDRKVSITHPDWHSHSWCTAAELEKVFQKGEQILRKEHGVRAFDLPEWYMVLEILKKFEAWGYQVRMVFWFDN
ncbi:MAG: hypothetical protein ACOC4Y_01370 [bacterium]